MAASLLSLTAALAAYNAISNDYEVPKLNLTELATDRWWGPADKKANQDTEIHCATITYEDDMVEDLKMRLRKTKTNVQPLEGGAFMYGFNHVALANWTEYWLNSYDFEEQQHIWNKYPLYKTNIQGLDIYYYRITPQVNDNTELIPLMILHGWPSSPLDFFDSIPQLTAVSKDRDFAFDLILPCLPGFGFSEAAVRPGLGPAQIGVVMRNLMHRIGYKRFYIAGGDVGGFVGGNMATRFPDEVLGFHSNWGLLISPVAMFLQIVGETYPSLIVSDKAYNRMYPLSSRFNVLMSSTGYMHLQVTRPDGIAVSLQQSPIGLLGYIMEKFSATATKFNFLRDDGGLFQSYDPNFLIDTLMFYWSTNSITSSMRLYAENMNKFEFGLRMEEITTPVPTWLLAAPEEISYQGPVILSLKYKNILGETILDEGGHFISHQHPDVYVADVFKAVTAFREWHAANGTDTRVY